MKVVITAATQMEWQVINDALKGFVNEKNINITYHTSGIGLMATTFSLTQCVVQQQPQLLLQVGIAGALNHTLALGEVVIVHSDCSGDLLAEEHEQLVDIFDLGLQDANVFPFTQKKLENPWLEKLDVNDLKKVKAITVNEITTRRERIKQLQLKYNAEIETMEGAALHYVGLQTGTPFIQLKAISNYAGERNKSNWKIREALENLPGVVLQLLENPRINSLEKFYR